MGDYDRSRGGGRGGDRGGRDGGSDSRRRPEDVSKMFSIKIDNISFDTTRESLEKHYDSFGEIGDVYIPKDRESGRSRGFAFVRFTDESAAETAIKETDGTDVDGRQVRVEMAKPMRRDGGGGPGGGGYRGGRGGDGGGYRGGGGGRSGGYGGGGGGYRDGGGGGGYRGGGGGGGRDRRDDRRRSRSRDRGNGGNRDRRDYR